MNVAGGMGPEYQGRVRGCWEVGRKTGNKIIREKSEEYLLGIG